MSAAAASEVNGWKVASAICGVTYFCAWSASFYPQIILNYRRKTTLGLSPDFVLLNPVGFLGLAIWSWGAYFSPTARRQYAERHDGHYPQVSASDLAFSAHAALLATITLIQSAYYLRRRRATGLSVDESSPLIAKDDGTQNSPTRPSRFARGLLVFIIASTAVQALLLSARKTDLLDVLYFASTVKLIITIVKYIPQMVLNYRIKTVKGFAIAAIICDSIGGVLSLLQLVIESVFIDHAPVGIIANPGKLGLSIITLGFDAVFIIQHYFLYPPKHDDDDDEHYD